MFTRPQLRLTHKGALVALNAAIAEAELLGVPENICIVDERCTMLAFVHMDNAKPLSIDSCRSKAETAASSRIPTGSMRPEIEIKMALATGGRATNLGGGLPIIFDSEIVGGIGVGSGTVAEDLLVAKAALRAIGALDFE